MKRRKILSFIGIALASSSLTIACNAPTNDSGGETTITPDTTGEAVDLTGQELTIYSGRNEELIGPLLERFEEETGVTVEVRYGDTAELAAAILEEGENTPADVYFGQDAGALGALQKEGRTKAIPENLLGRVDSRFRSPEGQWVGISGRARTLAYNVNEVEETELPETIWELTEEQWSGRVAWAPTNGSFQSFVTAMRVTEGDDRTREWLQGLIDNNAQVYPNNTTTVEAVGRGEADIGLVNNYYLGRFTAEDPDFPVAHHYTGGDVGSMINVAGVSILDATDSEPAAIALIDFLLTEESQTYFSETTNEYPLLEGVAPPQDQISIAEINPPAIDLSNLDDLEGTLNLLREVGAIQ
ncbi:iron ABC transporter substrate-binding protein [Cyanobacterium stanieri LEGE 03274]|uniref:Iron ABC transporter substrate-binding protein n=1 Tax=Cyanobacterium stanieri LEGE 03274 TaxID=1828756 RepID=A0ABR9V2B2_9CHRO|nr:iron ABC transporter substrate-binding protein [Cyanobacterium stanieri]MBE9221686.1 iron ABC transporter substrate-binding protein [Cyanobacterium stanieri LEGE 03274]